MAARYERELKEMLVDYINYRGDVNKLKKVLKTKSVAIRYDLLMNVRGDEAIIGVQRATYYKDEEMVRCMLADFTPEQTFNVLKLQTDIGNTTLHTAAYFGHVEGMKYLLNCVNQQQRFDLLTMKGKMGYTVLHRALAYDKRDIAEMILSTLSLQQQLHLINIKDGKNKSVADLYPDRCLPVELAAQAQAELKLTLDEQATVIAKQKREMAEQKREIAELKREFSQEIQRSQEKQAELEVKLSALEIFIRKPVVLGDEDNQEHAPHA